MPRIDLCQPNCASIGKNVGFLDSDRRPVPVVRAGRRTERSCSRPSLPPNHSKTTRILPVGFAATLRLAWASTGGTGPMPPRARGQSRRRRAAAGRDARHRCSCQESFVVMNLVPRESPRAGQYASPQPTRGEARRDGRSGVSSGSSHCWGMREWIRDVVTFSRAVPRGRRGRPRRPRRKRRGQGARARPDLPAAGSRCARRGHRDVRRHTEVRRERVSASSA